MLKKSQVYRCIILKTLVFFKSLANIISRKANAAALKPNISYKSKNKPSKPSRQTATN